MSEHVIWALVAALWALASWDMVRRWSFATATRALKADFDALRAEIAADRELKLPERVKRLESLVNGLKTHAENERVARVNPFRRGAG